jgi:hypothetical protein
MDYGKKPYKFDFERDSRTVRARNYVFSKDELVSYRILGVYNSIGEIDIMNDAYVTRYANQVFRKDLGQVAAIETSIQTFPIEGKTQGVMGEDGVLRHIPMRSNPLKVVSVIVFEDEFSWNVFAMKNKGLYGSGAILHLLN